MKNIHTCIIVSVISLVLAVACSFLMLAADAPIREAGTYPPLLFGAVFTWSTTRALLAERDHELHRDSHASHNAA